MKLFAIAMTGTAVGVTGLAPPPWTDDADDSSQKICPSVYAGDESWMEPWLKFPDWEGCYTQIPEIWTPGKDVECEMTNPNCLQVTCKGGSMQAQIQGNLFHTHKSWHEDNFVDELLAEKRTLKINGKVLVHNDSCGYKVKQETGSDGNLHNIWIIIDWDYKTCNEYFEPEVVGEDIVYSVKLQSIGNDADNNDDIEFYVNTEIKATCKYDRNILLNSSFYVNQEDTLINKLSDGQLDDVAECNFFIDEGRTKPINADNIVNMGQTIYGQVKSKLQMGDLRYRLTDLVVSDGSAGSTQTYSVIDGNVPSAEVYAESDGTADTGSTLDFSYMAFGFEDLSHQNQLLLTCHVSIEKNPCSDFTCDEGDGKVIVGDKCECTYTTVEVILVPATDAEAGTTKAPGVNPDFAIAPDNLDDLDGYPSYTFQANGQILEYNAETMPFKKTAPFKFVKGDWLWFKTRSDNGAALSQMQLQVCYNVGNVAEHINVGQTRDCKMRNVKFFGKDSFWFDQAAEKTNSCQSTESTMVGADGKPLCAAMGDDSFKISNCLEEGKIELTFDAETHANAVAHTETELELVYPVCPCSDITCAVGEDYVIVDGKCECAFKTVQVLFWPATDAEAGTNKAAGAAPYLSIGPDVANVDPIYNIQGIDKLEYNTADGTSFIKTDIFKFANGDWLWFKASSSNGAALSEMHLLICYNVGQQDPDCKARKVKFFDEDSFWFDKVAQEMNSCQSFGSVNGESLCAAMGDLGFKIKKCLEEGKIELTFNAETHANALTYTDTKLDLVYPKCS